MESPFSQCFYQNYWEKCSNIKDTTFKLTIFWISILYRTTLNLHVFLLLQTSSIHRSYSQHFSAFSRDEISINFPMNNNILHEKECAGKYSNIFTLEGKKIDSWKMSSSECSSLPQPIYPSSSPALPSLDTQSNASRLFIGLVSWIETSLFCYIDSKEFSLFLRVGWKYFESIKYEYFTKARNLKIGFNLREPLHQRLHSSASLFQALADLLYVVFWHWWFTISFQSYPRDVFISESLIIPRCVQLRFYMIPTGVEVRQSDNK